MIVHLVLLGTLTVTAYRPVPWQTKPECIDRHHCETADGNNVSELGAAISQDLLSSRRVHFGDVIYISGIGYRTVDDTMSPRNRNAVDLFVYEKSEEKKIGIRYLKVWLVPKPEIEGGLNGVQGISK